MKMSLFIYANLFTLFSDEINSTGIRVHVVGRLSLLPNDMQSSMSRIMLATRNNKTLRVNIAFAYTGNTTFIYLSVI